MADPAESDSGRSRPLGPKTAAVRSALLVLIALLGAAWALEVQYYLDFVILKEQFLALELVLGLVALFMSTKARPSENLTRVPLYDWVLIAATVVAGGNIVLFYQRIVYDLASLSTQRWVFGLIAVILVLEATRRTAGWALVVIAVLFIVYTRYSASFPGLLNMPGSDWDRILAYLYVDTNALFGVPLGVMATIVIPFILFGQLLYAVNGDRFLTDFSLATMGRYRGGSAKVATVASSLFGTLSGSVVSNVVMDGPITIPMMQRGGYPSHIAAAIEAVASTGGQIMPPVMGITAFLIAEYLDIPYSDVVIAAVLPAVLYYLGVFFYIDFEAVKRGLSGVPRDQLPKLRSLIGRCWVFFVPIAILLWTLLGEAWQPQRAAMAAVAATVVIGFAHPSTRPTPARLVNAFAMTGRTVMELVALTSVAGLVIGAVQLSGLGFNMSEIAVRLASGSLLLLLVVTGTVCILLGMGLPTAVIYVMLAVLIAPSLIRFGVSPMAAHLFILYYGGLSMITPPIAFATIAASAIARSDFWRTGWAGVRIGAAAYVVPFAFVFRPELLLQGSVAAIILAAAATVAGLLIVTLAMAGHFFGTIGLPGRCILFASGALLTVVPLHGRLWLALYGCSMIAAALMLGAAVVRARARRPGR